MNTIELNSKEYRDRHFPFNGNGVKDLYNSSRLLKKNSKNNNSIRFLAETIEDKYKNVKANDLTTYSHSSRSQEYVIDDYLIQLTTSYNEEKVLDGTYPNVFDISIVDLENCKNKLYTDNTIDETIPLIIIKVEKITELIYEKNIQFEVYNPNTKKIIENKEIAEKNAEEAEALKRKYDAKVTEIEEEEKKRLSEANRRASEEYDRIVEAANNRADQILEDAGRKADMVAAVRDAEQERKIADIVSAAAKKMVAAKTDAETDKNLIEEFLSKAGEEDGR